MIKNSKKLNLLGIMLLLITTVAWGSAFTILKDTTDDMPFAFVIGIRFGVSGAIISLVLIKQLIKINAKTLLHGVILGMILFVGYVLQTLGLRNTTPSRNAFVTSTYCVMCPFMFWIYYKERPKIYNIASAIICIIGIGFIALSKSESYEGSTLLGDGLTLISAVFFALQIIFIEAYQNDKNPTMLLPVELLTAGILCFFYSFIFEFPNHALSDFAIKGDNVFNICYLTLFCTLFAQAGQFFGQKFSPSPSVSSLLLSLESVFGAVFSVLLGNEKLSTFVIIGFVIVFIAVLITVLQIDIVRLFKKGKKPPLDLKE